MENRFAVARVWTPSVKKAEVAVATKPAFVICPPALLMGGAAWQQAMYEAAYREAQATVAKRNLARQASARFGSEIVFSSGR